jgi:putative transcriptional regulator
MNRNLFAELCEGIDALAASRDGKITLRTHTVKLPALQAVAGAELRVNARTLENWEQGRATPNAQATTLIRLLQKYPATLEQLATLT